MTNAMQTGTAVDAWDKRWATDSGRADWLDPHPAVVALLPELRGRGARAVLDLGCGVGRHALLLAEAGLRSRLSMAARPGSTCCVRRRPYAA
jgi:tellurite methyltransferase